ncbi:adenylate/guanylate cyclase domain-containing protein [Muriicola sp. Z0-33]|uniref:adenylate/guanylate cyclase domain-containing protein n=1 Tax=Muriicola sp. Z0-33 TaxID=2816957 RepID=UPI002237B1D2|nr:adenylate/guanylate cyclase domain-containing protein [Muriicola sp. Z0-33]MCW5517466.1 adenylate/guanylate cyclase domain-containing protein [Muriicola sp. Z0-33]
MISSKLKNNVSRILPYGIIWLAFGLIFLIVEYAATKNAGDTPAGVIQLNYTIFIFAMIAVTLVGLLIGVIELMFINRFFTKRSFLAKILGKFIFYSVFLFLIICITYPVAASLELKTSLFDAVIWDKFSEYLYSITFFSTAFQMTISLVVTLFYAEISENMGPGVFLNFILGKYHKPKEENRIFMFLDMKSSTAIAEKIGHSEYFEFLKAYYFILSKALIKYSAEIYQYVGDEMVISWKRSKGIKDNNCIRCFFAMKNDLKNKQDWFDKQFGLHPEFKAGLHYGAVMTGEIGSVKKVIIFTGDTLNATSRIQSLCNQYGVDNLISGDLHGILKLETDYEVASLGNKELRGKLKAMELFTVKQKSGS